MKYRLKNSQAHSSGWVSLFRFVFPALFPSCTDTFISHGNFSRLAWMPAWKSTHRTSTGNYSLDHPDLIFNYLPWPTGSQDNVDFGWKALASGMVVFSFRGLHILSSLPAVCVCSRSRSIHSARHLAWSCSFLCKTLHFTPWVWPLRLLVFLVACSTVDCNSCIETSRNARGFWNPILDRITVFWNWRGNCNSNNSEIQHQTPVLLTSGKGPNPKRFAFQTNLKTAGALQEWQNWPDLPHFCGTKPRCSHTVSSTFAISESVHF